MQARSKELWPACEIRGDLKFKRHHFWSFYQSGGKLKRGQTKSRLTLEHIKNRLEFARKWEILLDKTDGESFYWFLDEKWFYTTSRRRKFKILPKAIFQNLKDAFFVPHKIRSRILKRCVNYQLNLSMATMETLHLYYYISFLPLCGAYVISQLCIFGGPPDCRTPE